MLSAQQPLDLRLRAESFLRQPVAESKEPLPFLRPLAANADAAVGVVGDGKGTIGHGLGKAREVSEAIGKAVKDGEKNMIRVPLLNGTIPHEAHGKYDAGRVLIKPAAHGTGVIAGGAMRAVLEMAGVQDVLAKSQGSSSPHNVVKAPIAALASLRSPAEVARQRGITLEKLFNG